MSPLASASRTLGSGTPSPRWTRSSNGIFAASETAAASDMGVSVKGTVDHVHLLLARQPHEIHRVAGDADRQARIFLRMIHRVEQHVPVQDVDVHVIAGG